jgi:peptide/nickel transport system permease protein
MLVYTLRRVVLGVLVLGALSLASFCALASQDVTLNTSPLLPQYWTWLKGVFTGRSVALIEQPVLSRPNPLAGTTFLEAIGHTAALLGVTFVLVVLFAVGLALVAAVWRGSFLDSMLKGLSYVAWALPAFLLALMVQKAFFSLGNEYGWGPFPLAGWPGSCPPPLGLDAGVLPSCPAAGSGLSYLANLGRYLTLPAAALAVGLIGLHGRYLRSALLETLDSPFIVTARAKGLADRRVVLSHAMRVALPTFLAAVLSDFGAIFGAALAVDWIFGLNGLGSVLVSDFPGPLDQSAFTNTYSAQLVVLIAGILVLATSFIAELAVARLDPRMQGAS